MNVVWAQRKRSDRKPSEPPKKKDAWDKAQILSGFISSVVIAGVGILINISIQNAQIRASAENSRAQLKAADRNNDAQLALTERNSALQRHLQEATLAGQLAEHLTGSDPLKKRIAIIVLRRSVPPEMYQDVIKLVVQSELDSDVRKTALEQAQTLRDVDPKVIDAITQAASARSGEERTLAEGAVRQIGLSSAAPSSAYLLSSSGLKNLSEEMNNGGGIFTRYLLNGLWGQGNIRMSDLGRFVTNNVKRASKGAQTSIFLTPQDNVDPVIVGTDKTYSGAIVVVIGNTYYENIANANLAMSDAAKFFEFWNLQKNATITHISNAKRADMLTALTDAAMRADNDNLLVIYYSGRAFSISGEGYIAPVDVTADTIKQAQQTGISTEEVRQILSVSRAQIKVLFIDASFFTPTER